MEYSAFRDVMVMKTLDPIPHNSMKKGISVNIGFTSRWTVILFSFFLFYFPSVLAVFSSGDEPREWTWFSVIMSTFYAFVFCVNYFWIVPSTLIRTDRKPLYFLINFCMILSICSVVPVLFDSLAGLPRPHHAPQPRPGIGGLLVGYLRFVIRDGTMMILSAALALALRLSSERENMRRKELELQGERRQMELQSLKAQLNPHFLFNSLNNIYALIGFAPDRAQQALHELSGMLRFMIYESGSPLVPLEKEIQFIHSYVELMKLRLSPSVDLRCDIRAVPRDLRIAPLILLTFVENAFKHSAPNGSSHFISVSVNVDGRSLSCDIANSCSGADGHVATAAAAEPADGRFRKSGVGLDNVRRQLGLIYPGSHAMEITDRDGVYRVRLNVSL